MDGISVRATRRDGLVVLAIFSTPECLLRVTVDPASLPRHPYDRHRWMERAIVDAERDRYHSRPERLPEIEEWALREMPWIARLAEEMVRALARATTERAA